MARPRLYLRDANGNRLDLSKLGQTAAVIRAAVRIYVEENGKSIPEITRETSEGGNLFVRVSQGGLEKLVDWTPAKERPAEDPRARPQVTRRTSGRSASRGATGATRVIVTEQREHRNPSSAVGGRASRLQRRRGGGESGHRFGDEPNVKPSGERPSRSNRRAKPLTAKVEEIIEHKKKRARLDDESA